MRVTQQYLEQQLNNKQYEAAMAVEGPVLVFAGAGSGKTRVVTHRIAYLIDNGYAYPEQILAVTFTNKAAKEMKERVMGLVGGYSERDFYVQTFHSLGARILRRHAEVLGYKNSFTILDSNDQKSFMKHLISKWGWDPKENEAQKVLGYIEKQKRNFVLPSDLKDKDEPDAKTRRMIKAYTWYQAELKQNNCMDFSDLLFQLLILFKHHPEMREKYQSYWKFLLVDEFQDTNYVQLELIRILAAKHKNVFVVGDDDQSIYSFRGAEVGNILKFSKIFPGTQVVMLEQNYRSSKMIIEAASEVIKQNQGRADKTLWTDNDDGEKISLMPCHDERDEALKVANRVREWISNGESPNEIALFYRTNAQSRVLEETMRANGIAYRIVGGFSFYQRKEIKDFVSILNLIHNQSSDLDFIRAMSNPPRGVGETSMGAVVNYADENDMSCYEYIKTALSDTNFDLPRGKSRAEFEKLVKLVEELQDHKDDLVYLYDRIFQVIPFEAYYKKKQKPEDLARYDNLLEFKSVLVEAEANQADLAEFLENMALVTAEQGEGDEEKVTLMTVHSSKGLEFNCVAIGGLEEELFPQGSFYKDVDVQEERRLFYVAMTRARKNLYLSYAVRRLIYGRTSYNSFSRFITEIPGRYIDQLAEIAQPRQAYDIPRPGSDFSRGFERPSSAARPSAAKAAGQDEKDFVFFQEDQFKPGDRVNHNSFGEGVIEAVEGKRLKVVFPRVGKKTLLKNFISKV